jgi:hypothetical protein
MLANVDLWGFAFSRWGSSSWSRNSAGRRTKNHLYVATGIWI